VLTAWAAAGGVGRAQQRHGPVQPARHLAAAEAQQGGALHPADDAQHGGGGRAGGQDRHHGTRTPARSRQVSNQGAQAAGACQAVCLPVILELVWLIS
jgi:hypothetical protein